MKEVDVNGCRCAYTLQHDRAEELPGYTYLGPSHITWHSRVKKILDTQAHFYMRVPNWQEVLSGLKTLHKAKLSQATRFDPTSGMTKKLWLMKYAGEAANIKRLMDLLEFQEHRI